MSVFKTIADAVVAVITPLAGTAYTVELRKDDSVTAREGKPVVIVTMGDFNEVGALSGAGTDADQGDTLITYQIGVSIYRTCLGDIDEDLTQSPDLIETVKHALNKKSLASASSVYDTKLVSHPEWERQAFGKGYEVSRFGVLFYSAEERITA